MVKIVWHDKRSISKYNRHMLIFSNCITWLLFQEPRTIFFKMKIMIEVVQHDQRNILKILYFLYHASFIAYDVTCDVILLFWLILLINHCFMHLNLFFFKKIWSQLKLKVVRKTIHKQFPSFHAPLCMSVVCSVYRLQALCMLFLFSSFLFILCTLFKPVKR